MNVTMTLASHSHGDRTRLAKLAQVSIAASLVLISSFSLAKSDALDQHFALFDHKRVQGHELTTLPNSLFKSCLQACVDRGDCKAINFDISSNTCHVLDDSSDPMSDPNFMAAIRRGSPGSPFSQETMSQQTATTVQPPADSATALINQFKADQTGNVKVPSALPAGPSPDNRQTSQITFIALGCGAFLLSMAVFLFIHRNRQLKGIDIAERMALGMNIGRQPRGGTYPPQVPEHSEPLKTNSSEAAPQPKEKSRQNLSPAAIPVAAILLVSMGAFAAYLMKLDREDNFGTYHAIEHRAVNIDTDEPPSSVDYFQKADISSHEIHIYDYSDQSETAKQFVGSDYHLPWLKEDDGCFYGRQIKGLSGNIWTDFKSVEAAIAGGSITVSDLTYHGCPHENTFVFASRIYLEIESANSGIATTREAGLCRPTQSGGCEISTVEETTVFQRE